MPLIHVWNLDPHAEHVAAGFPQLCLDLRDACMQVKELDIKDGNDTLVSFQGKAMRAELKSRRRAPLLIVVDLLYEKPGRTLEVKNALAKAVGKAAKSHAPAGQPIEVFVRTFDPKTEASWFSNG